jgi:carboxyl-terminal processing protease
MGMPTFGKGSVQTVYPLDGGAGLRLTTALYYTPAGRSIQEVGIVPDIEVHPGSPERGVLYRGVRERDLRRHISHDAASSGSPGVEDLAEDSDAEPEAGDPEADVDDGAEVAEEGRDVMIARALEVLKSWTYFDRLSGREASARPPDAGSHTAPEE